MDHIPLPLIHHHQTPLFHLMHLFIRHNVMCLVVLFVQNTATTLFTSGFAWISGTSCFFASDVLMCHKICKAFCHHALISSQRASLLFLHKFHHHASWTHSLQAMSSLARAFFILLLLFLFFGFLVIQCFASSYVGSL